eukprot:CAMPEP_0118679808 /NCGR_PEP_ID=MMETSP0800-20121206/3996_1 /TAXON_ID=210618 ORGANISM="Striatella unipunctata, Strain CCMP2910" /NCGR_SAMPLE_ID=MMETSP0800 /ASSEMBLY_ACC=CAM_ASM_000638 /LENGTH=419 /DNA_ID=CAMNT_0006575849 /DNA_START=21 /DNA_END=1280 /DNA_ORIENTATION=+
MADELLSGGLTEGYSAVADAGGTFTDITSQSWGSRIKESCTNIVIGVILFIAAFPVLFWNEGRAVQRYDTLLEGRSSVIEISVDKIDGASDGALVYFTSMVTSDGAALTDPVFGISTQDLKFRRHVQMYQWDQSVSERKVKQMGGKEKTVKDYSYHTTWASNAIDSTRFKYGGHDNPGPFPFENYFLQQEAFYVGAFELPPEIENYVSYYSDMTDISIDGIPDPVLRNETKPLAKGDGFFIGTSEYKPEVGDIMVTFDSIPPHEISIVGEQSANTFKEYQTKAGGTILLFERGIATAEELFEQAEAENTIITWLLRLAGLVAIHFGVYLVFQPIIVVLDVLPILGDLAECGLNCLAFFVAVLFGGTTIAIAWLFHHPIFGITVLVIVAGIVGGTLYVASKFGKKKNKYDAVETEEGVMA